jgi:4-amino-4-deoxy-L-arabinose transferase-like glycosyltransferase
MHGELKPVSFLGIILIYGFIASIVGYEILPYLTPLFASFGIIFFYFLIRELFGKRNALISAFLLSVFPVWIYYSGRSMFHNVLFVSLLVIGLYFAYKMTGENKKSPGFFTFSLSHINWKSWLFAGLAGIFIGLAATARTSELLWMLPGGLVLWLFNIRKIGITKLTIFFAFLVISMLPMFYWNQILYDSPIYGGYPEMNNSIEGLKQTGEGLAKSVAGIDSGSIVDLFNKAKGLVFYFGFNPELSQKMFVNYVIKMFPRLFWPALLGLFMLVQGVGKWGKQHWAYICSYIVISLILVYYYGSWEFHDNPDKASFTIGNSYTRYWLPIYMGALPFVAIFVGNFPRQILSLKREDSFAGEEKGKIKKHLNKFSIKRILAGTMSLFFVFLIAYNMINFVLYGSEEGMVRTVNVRKSEKSQYEQILKSTPEDAVIITTYHDKLLFPQRKVMVGLLKDGNMIKNYSKLADILPVYYYNFTLPPEAINYLNQGRLGEADLKLKEYRQINDVFHLYKLSKIENVQ